MRMNFCRCHPKSEGYCKLKVCPRPDESIITLPETGVKGATVGPLGQATDVPKKNPVFVNVYGKDQQSH